MSVLSWAERLNAALAEFSDRGGPEVGRSYYLPATVLGHAVTARVTDVQTGKALVTAGDAAGHGVWVPVPSFGWFLDDMRGRIDVPPGSGDQALESLARGEGEFLGKGDDGICFATPQGEVVKASTTVPRRPLMDDHRTPEEAADNLRAQYEKAERLRSLGVPVPPSRFAQHAGRAYVVMPRLDIPERLNHQQLLQVRDALGVMHSAGWALRDRPQLGVHVAGDGRLYLFDTGKATDAASDGDVENDVKEFKRLAGANGLAEVAADFGQERWPAGTPGGLGGKFKPKDGAPAAGAAGATTPSLAVEERDKVAGAARILLGREVSDADLAGLAGNPPGGDLVVYYHPPFEVALDEAGKKYGKRPGIDVEIKGDGYKGVVSLQMHTYGHRVPGLNGKVVLYVGSLDVDAAHRGRGIATHIIANAVDAARRLGVRYVTLYAEGDPGSSTNGYYTWPRMGFDAEIPPHLVKIKLPPEFQDARTVLDVLARPGGRAFWLEHGYRNFCVFDTDPASKSSKVLAAYLEERKARLASQPAAHSAEPGLSPLEEAALDAVWDRIEKGGWDSLSPPTPLGVGGADFAQERWPAGTPGGLGGKFKPGGGDDAPPPEAPPPSEPRPAVKAATPREKAAAATARSIDQGDYFAARHSAVPNAGEDIALSARHVRNAWRGLEDAERQGTAAELVTRDQLFKNEPLNILAGVGPATALSSLAAHLAVRQFPASPESKYAFRRTGEQKKQDRENYLDAYRAVKAAAEKAAATGAGPGQVLKSVQAAVHAEVQRLREKSGRYDPVANSLTVTAARLRVFDSPRWQRKADAAAQVFDFVSRVQKKYGPDVGQDTLARVAEHVKDVLEGDSFNKTFGTVKGKGGQLNPADLYVNHAERVGGSVVDASTVKAATSYMTDSLKLRGIQYGNSVTDDERQHHLKFAAESLADLTDVLGLAPEDASLGGQLGIAFGARGKGNALAHYEPALRVINLTRKNGVGSLCHEWGHFFDNMMGRRAGTSHGDDSYLSALVHASGRYQANPTNHPAPGVAAAMAGVKLAMEPVRRRVLQWLRDNPDKVPPSKVPYWASTPEMFARCFEGHVGHKLAARGRKNTYLAGVMPHPLWPTGEETAALAPAFDALFAAYSSSRPPAAMGEGGPHTGPRGGTYWVTAGGSKEYRQPGPPRRPAGYVPGTQDSSPNKALPEEARPHADAEQAQALYRYTAHSDLVINPHLRAEVRPPGRHGDDHDAVQRLFSSLEKFPEPVHVQRGLRLDAKGTEEFLDKLRAGASAGTPVVMGGYLSTTTLPHVPGVWGGNVVLHIRAVKGIDMRPFARADRTGEDELLLDERSQFHVGSIAKDAEGKWEINLTQLPEPAGPWKKKGFLAAAVAKLKLKAAAMSGDDHAGRFIDTDHSHVLSFPTREGYEAYCRVHGLHPHPPAPVPGEDLGFASGPFAGPRGGTYWVTDSGNKSYRQPKPDDAPPPAPPALPPAGPAGGTDEYVLRAGAHEALDGWLKASDLPAKKAQFFRDTMRGVMGRMPAGSLAEFLRNAGSVKFLGSTTDVTREARAAFAVRAGKGYRFAGVVYWENEGDDPCRVLLDGDSYPAFTPKMLNNLKTMPGVSQEEYLARGTYAHEIGHAIDVRFRHSDTPEWRAAFRGEIDRPGYPLSRYATESPAEAWAEYARLLFSRPEAARDRFPKCYAVWRQRGLA
jgi:GNAT superfamily N-acetyltransferase